MTQQLNRKTIGDEAESLACEYLSKRGLSLLTRNYRCRGGEIDLIMRHNDSLVFIEVRYRRKTDYGRAAETVTANKQRRLIHCARVYMQRHHAWNMPARFDVVSIEGQAGQLQIDWISNAFQVIS
jgi:putative endonuclease